MGSADAVAQASSKAKRNPWFSGMRVDGLKGVGRASAHLLVMRHLTPLLIVLLGSALAWAQTLPKSGEVYESVAVDLNRDGKSEKLALVAYNIQLESESFFGRLRVTDSAGKVLWEGPKVEQAHQPFAFGMWPYGVSGLEWVGDLDGDGKVELVTRAPVSDVRPPTFCRYRWNGKAFVALPRKMLLEEKAGSGRFLWRDPVEWDGMQPLTWVSSFSGGPKEKIAEIVSSRKDGALWGGTARMKGDGLGLTATSWTTKLGPFE